MSVKADFELGQLAFATGKHHSDCVFKLPHRRAAWQRGYRDASHSNHKNNSAANISPNAQQIINLRNKLMEFQ